MTDRPDASTITDDQLDELYEQRDLARRIAVALEQRAGVAAGNKRHVQVLTASVHAGYELADQLADEGHPDVARRIRQALDTGPTRPTQRPAHPTQGPESHGSTNGAHTGAHDFDRDLLTAIDTLAQHLRAVATAAHNALSSPAYRHLTRATYHLALGDTPPPPTHTTEDTDR